MKSISNKSYIFNFMKLSRDDKKNIDLFKTFNHIYSNDAENAFLRVETLKGNLDYIKGLFTLKKGQRNAIKLLNEYQKANKVDIILDCNDNLQRYYLRNRFDRIVSCDNFHIMWRPYIITK